MYEVEIKVLLGILEKANQVLKEVQNKYQDFEVVGEFSQINQLRDGQSLRCGIE